jgi:hypothetical protein
LINYRITPSSASFEKFGTGIGDFQGEKTMLELKTNTIKFSFPEIHPDAELEVTFHRTLRIPDDGKKYALPPSLGAFPVKHVDDYKDRVPAEWMQRGGVMLPMYQCEALWISFKAKHVGDRGTKYPFAIKVGTGKISAVTGDLWVKGIKESDYLVTPPQPWLDGYCVEKGVIRQFVAAPLGWGFTAEEQITGEAEHGGLQLEVFPMDPEIFEQKFPKLPPRRYLGAKGGGATRGMRLNSVRRRKAAPMGLAPQADMGLAPGGTMKQEIHKDPHGREVWKHVAKSRVFVHLANSMAWEAITKEKPPATPISAHLYTQKGFPWYDWYDETPAMEGTEKLAGMKSVLEFGFQKGMNILPENESTNPDRVVVIKGQQGQVREGTW